MTKLLECCYMRYTVVEMICLSKNKHPNTVLLQKEWQETTPESKSVISEIFAILTNIIPK